MRPHADDPIWPTPTPWAGEVPYNLDDAAIMAAGQEAMVNMAESSVQTWQSANRDGAMDGFMTLMLLIIIVVALYSVYRRLQAV